VPVTAQRRTIAERMMSSLKNTAPVTLTCRCDATNLVALRSEYKLAAGNPIVPSFTDIIAKLAAIALGSHPMLAGRWEGERILLPDAIHIGIAVDTGHGLLVPVVRNVSELSLLEVSRRSRDLIEAARSRRLKSDDMQGGCFTLSNLGGFGIEAFTPIINYPETAVLGLGAILRAPAVLEDGQLGIREQITLSLTFDHRVVDGAPAARFLQALRQGIEKPAGWLSRETEGIAHDHRK
jgi:pyruvate dehydrogenase E2 component (dihydrolipoamide acetyltransferase)